MVEFSSEALFDTAAAITGTVAALIFVFNVDFGYSPVSKFLLVAVFLAGVFFLTQRTTDRRQTVLGYGVVVTSGVGLFFDVINTFDAGNTMTAFGFLAIAAVLFYLRTRLDEDSHFVSPTRAKHVFGVVAVLAVGVLLVDVVTGGLAYELQPESELELTDTPRDETVIGTVLVTNPTPFPERVQTPDYGVCAAGDWSEFRPPPEPGGPQRAVRANVYVQDGYNEHVLGFGRETYPVELSIHAANLTGETFPVRTTSTCPDEETGSPYLALFELPEN